MLKCALTSQCENNDGISVFFLFLLRGSFYFAANISAGKIFTLSSDKVVFKEAAGQCSGGLARVETKAEAEQVRKLIEVNSPSVAWIGLKKIASFTTDEQYFSNVSAILPYLRWSNESFVKNFSLSMKDLEFYEFHEHCIAIDVSQEEVKLRDYKCTEKKKVLCMNGRFLLNKQTSTLRSVLLSSCLS